MNISLIMIILSLSEHTWAASDFTGITNKPILPDRLVCYATIQYTTSIFRLIKFKGVYLIS